LINHTVRTNLLDDESLERSPIVASSRMNRERLATGGNRCRREFGLDPSMYLAERAAHIPSL
jgi:hypothetical protein